MHNIVKLFCVAAASALGVTAAQAQNAPLKMTLFGQPSVNNDAIWMAFEKGFYQEEGLDVTYRLFPSGTTAFQAFQTGQGDIVMTGEITLSGRVLPVGGIKEKVLAARRVGIREVILPRQNEKNINEDLTEELRRELTVHYVQSVDEVLLLALLPPALTTGDQKTERRAQPRLQ